MPGNTTSVGKARISVTTSFAFLRLQIVAPRPRHALRNRFFQKSPWPLRMTNNTQSQVPPTFHCAESALRARLAQKRAVRRTGMLLGSTMLAGSLAVASLSGVLPPLQPAQANYPYLISCFAACIALTVGVFNVELGRDGVLYLEMRTPRLVRLPRSQLLSLIEVRETNDGRGRGAFAVEHIPRGVSLGAYEGTLLDTAAFLTRYPADKGSYADYAIAVDAHYVVDGVSAAKSESFTPAHMNHSRARDRINVGRRHWRGRREVEMYTARDVPAGEELLFNYGDSYWSGREELEQL